MIADTGENQIGGQSNGKFSKLRPIATGKTTLNKDCIKYIVLNILFMVACAAVWPNWRPNHCCNAPISLSAKSHAIAWMCADLFKAALRVHAHNAHLNEEAPAERGIRKGGCERARAVASLGCDISCYCFWACLLIGRACPVCRMWFDRVRAKHYQILNTRQAQPIRKQRASQPNETTACYGHVYSSSWCACAGCSSAPPKTWIQGFCSWK